jgi:hypothetical protein
MTELAEWDSFYVIVGSSAGALIGLQFVVITLLADKPQLRAEEASGAFATPTIFHFSAVLLLSALMRVPWPGIAAAMLCWTLLGLGGLIYLMVVVRRISKQRAYRPAFEDWLFHFVFPAVAYVVLVASAFGSTLDLSLATFGLAGASLVLLLTAIHNAWDGVVYTAFAKTGK